LTRGAVFDVGRCGERVGEFGDKRVAKIGELFEQRHASFAAVDVFADACRPTGLEPRLQLLV
jgi:hypothetical protein